MAKNLLLALLTVGLVITASAADPKTAVTTPVASATSTKGLKRYPFHANVAAVDFTAKTITLDGKKSHRVLHITPNTRLMKDKKPVALETIKVGDYITGSVIDTGGYLEPTSINLGGLPKQVAQAPATPPVQTPPQAQSPSVKVARPGSSTKK